MGADEVVRSLAPSFTDDRKGSYLAYRSSGFTLEESLKLSGVTHKALHHWRENSPEFKDSETSVTRDPETRRQFAMEFTRSEFLRNYRLVMEKDFRVLRMSLVSGDKPMPQQDFAYLLKARAHYTPEHLKAIEELLGQTEDKDFDFTHLVMTLSRRTVVESVSIEAKKVD